MRALTWRAAVVAVVLVAGACGNSADGGSGSGDGLPKLPLGAVGSSRSSAGAAAMSAEAAADSTASSKSMIAPFRAVEYRVADDADAVPKTARAYQLEARSAGEVRSKVAKALDVDPDRVEVGAGGYDWYYSGQSPDTAVSSSSVSSSPACAPEEKCDPGSFAPPPTVQGVPTAADAERRVRDILGALDVSLDGRFEVFGEDGYNRTVQFTPSIDGVPVLGLQTQIAFGADARIDYANGLLADVEAIGTYPLVTLAEAVKRLSEGFGSGGVRTLGAPQVDVATDPAATSDAVGGGVAEGGGSAGSTGSAGTARSGGSSGSAGGASSGSAGTTGSGATEPGFAGSCAGTGTDPSASSGTGTSAGATAIAPAEPCADTPPPDPACDTDRPCSTPPEAPTVTIEPQPAEPLEPQIVEITGADLSLQLVAAGCPGDPVYLVPTFELRAEPGPAGSVIAVEDDVISGQPAVGDPGFQPCPDQGQTDVPVGKPEPAPMPADAGREPAKP